MSALDAYSGESYIVLALLILLALVVMVGVTRD
jgi:hypothetical protein